MFPGMPTNTVRWKPWESEGLEHLVLREDGGRITAESLVIATDEGEHFAVRYQIVCDRDWRVRAAEIEKVGTDTCLNLRSDGQRNWSTKALDGAIDIDLTITPFTNTLPIRRLALQKGGVAEIDVAYVTFPAMTLTRERQIYTCLEPMRRYRFETGDKSFMREIEVDAAGLVVTYPGLFSRVI
jgi:hypothetical protein